MLRKLMICVAAAFALAACQGGGGAPSPSTGATAGTGSHAALVASLGDGFIWDCSLQDKAGTFPPRFVLQRQNLALRPEIVMLSAGARSGRLVEVTTEDYARVFKLRDHSGVLIASDGSVFPLDVRGAPIEGDPIGTCSRGGQPI